MARSRHVWLVTRHANMVTGLDMSGWLPDMQILWQGLGMSGWLADMLIWWQCLEMSDWLPDMQL